MGKSIAPIDKQVVVWKFPTGGHILLQDFTGSKEVGVASNVRELKALATGGYMAYTNRENGDWLTFKEALAFLAEDAQNGVLEPAPDDDYVYRRRE